MSVCVHRPSLRLFAVAERKQGSIDADEMKGGNGRARVTRAEGECGNDGAPEN